MQETENQRLKILMSMLGFHSQSAFAEALDVKPGSLSDILRGKKGLGVSSSIKYKLESKFDVNRKWLETGMGNVFKGLKSRLFNLEPNNENSNSNKTNIEKVKRIEFLIKHLNFKNQNDFAKQIKMSSSYLSEVLNQKKLVPKYMWTKLDKFFGVSENWFEHGIGAVFTNENNLNSLPISNQKSENSEREKDDRQSLIVELKYLRELAESRKEIINLKDEKIARLEAELNSLKSAGSIPKTKGHSVSDVAEPTEELKDRDT